MFSFRYKGLELSREEPSLTPVVFSLYNAFFEAGIPLNEDLSVPDCRDCVFDIVRRLDGLYPFFPPEYGEAEMEEFILRALACYVPGGVLPFEEHMKRYVVQELLQTAATGPHALGDDSFAWTVGASRPYQVSSRRHRG